MSRNSTTPAPAGAFAKDRAAFWRVSLRTMQKWLAEQPPLPVADERAMIRWYASLPGGSQAKLTRTFRLRIDELRLSAERGHGAPINDPDYDAFKVRAQATASTDSGFLASLKEQRDFLSFKISACLARNDPLGAEKAGSQLHVLSGIIHDEELRAQRLGREIGEIISKDEAERIFRAIPYWLLRSVDELLSVLSKRIAAASASPLFPEEVRQMIEPHLIDARVLEPFVRASRVSAGTTIPKWAVEAMHAAHAATLDDPAGEFSRLYAAPLPPPPAHET